MEKGDITIERKDTEEEAILFSMKNQGYERKDPQTESVPKNSSKNKEKVLKNYNCKICSYTGNGEVHFNNHMQLIHGMEQPFRCEKCGEEFGMKSYLSNHMNLRHKDKYECEEEFNCVECYFQGSSKFQLAKHINLKHDQKEEIPAIPGSIKCRICDEIFEHKSNLMIHRKLNHKGLVAKCKKFEDRNCSRTSESCWWNHEYETDSLEKIKCYVCNESFNTKREMMEHRKKYHAKLVKFCMNFMRGKCQFRNESCWFIHNITQDKNDDSKAVEEMETDSVFQKEKEKMKPPLQGEKTNIKMPN